MWKYDGQVTWSQGKWWIFFFLKSMHSRLGWRKWSYTIILWLSWKHWNDNKDNRWCYWQLTSVKMDLLKKKKLNSMGDRMKYSPTSIYYSCFKNRFTVLLIAEIFFLWARKLALFCSKLWQMFTGAGALEFTLGLFWSNGNLQKKYL